MIIIGNTKGFSAVEAQKLDQAIALANQAMGTEEFKAKVLAHGYTCTNESPTQVYHAVACPKWMVNFQIETPPFFKRLFTKEIAREVTGVGVVFNRDKFLKQGLASLAGTVAHECAHVAGYAHPFWASKDRDESVPYQIGNFVESLVRDGTHLTNEIVNTLKAAYGPARELPKINYYDGDILPKQTGQ